MGFESGPLLSIVRPRRLLGQALSLGTGYRPLKSANCQIRPRVPTLSRRASRIMLNGVSGLRQARVAFGGPPQDQSWGARMVGLKDPDGNNLYLLQRLQTPSHDSVRRH